MTEPEYTYVKGQGWVLSYCETLTARGEGYTLILQARKPEKGEHYFSSNNSGNTTANLLKEIATNTYWRRNFIAYKDRLAHLVSTWGGGEHFERYYWTLTVEYD
jgi:hypothetical protein